MLVLHCVEVGSKKKCAWSDQGNMCAHVGVKAIACVDIDSKFGWVVMCSRSNLWWQCRWPMLWGAHQHVCWIPPVSCLLEAEEILLCVVACYFVTNAPAVGTTGTELRRRTMHSFIHSFNHAFIPLFMRSFFHLLIHSCICAFMSCIDSFMALMPVIHSFIH